MKLTITVTMGNDAMQTRGDAASAIASALLRMGHDAPLRDGDDGVVMDENGNTVGGWTADDEPAAEDVNGEPGEHTQAELDRMREALEATGRYDVVGRKW